MNEDILDIFYNSIIPKASRGTIDCFMYYNICFNNRNLYKANENFVINDFNEDLKNITPSSLVALDLFLLHFNNLGYTKFKLAPYLPIRWIDKKIMINKKSKKVLEKSKKYKEGMEELLRIQDNISQKFITTFRRLNYHLNVMI